MLDVVSFKQHITGLVEKSADPVSVSEAGKNIQSCSFLIAFSGGLDSHALLHLVQACKFPLRAVYIDHGLQSESSHWASHCQSVCQQLGIAFKTISVAIDTESGESLEASARHARYSALAADMKAGEILLTAQHINDQSETFMLQLLRTAGPAGLSAMPASKTFACGYHLRPLLTTSRSEIEQYAKIHNLNWIEDPSNQDQRFDRNFFRHAIFPLLERRWPSIHQTLSNVTGIQAEATELMTELAAIDANTCMTEKRLQIDGLTALSLPRQRNLVRYWLQQLELDIPTAKRLDEILGTMITAAGDRIPVVQWQQTEVRRFQNELYALKKRQELDSRQSIHIEKDKALSITALDAELYFEAATTGLKADIFKQDLEIRFRQGGEKIKPMGRAHTMDLKKLCQQAGIPPWLRSRLPLLYLNDKLIAVADYWVADEVKNQPNQPAWLLKTRVL